MLKLEEHVCLKRIRKKQQQTLLIMLIRELRSVFNKFYNFVSQCSFQETMIQNYAMASKMLSFFLHLNDESA